MPKQDYYQQGQLTDVAYLVLLSLATPRHGYAIMSHIEMLTQGTATIGPASLYTTLRKLMQAKFIHLLEDTDAKKVYGLTMVGLAALKVETEKRERLATYGRQALRDALGGAPHV